MEKDQLLNKYSLLQPREIFTEFSPVTHPAKYNNGLYFSSFGGQVDSQNVLPAV